MNDLLCFALVTSLKIAFIHVVFTWEGMAFCRLGRIMEYKLHPLLHKPLFSCQVCMASVWGIVFWLLEGNAVDVDEIKPIIEFLFLVGGFNVILSCLMGASEMKNQFE